ncbi:MAG: tRNA (adenosine(37)-N6)-threonylcarbamoyltransferase complex ATPase subunit type 1 TsaE [bacterium]|nr:tRNA (adenosine(37)-N6)-threonylcarbamoyltransferase complex ATPase subunit type 1 TsaE [bacterium]
MYISKSTEHTERLANKIGVRIKSGGIVCLYGDLGSGKTIFTKGIAEALNIEKFSIKSPTYTYIRHYKKDRFNFYHIDLYRLEEIDELMLKEIEELIENGKNIIVIEWADRMKDNLPEKRIDVSLEYLDENARKIEIND